jgi:hypothetical protein
MATLKDAFVRLPNYLTAMPSMTVLRVIANHRANPDVYWRFHVDANSRHLLGRRYPAKSILNNPLYSDQKWTPMFYLFSAGAPLFARLYNHLTGCRYFTTLRGTAWAAVDISILAEEAAGHRRRCN